VLLQPRPAAAAENRDLGQHRSDYAQAHLREEDLSYPRRSMKTAAGRYLRRLWSVIAKRLPEDVVLAVLSLRWTLPLAVYRLSGRRLAYSPDLYKAEILHQQLERSRIPGMTKMTERAYFKWHAQEEVTGTGAIVDLGCWLGSTTAAMAMGLSANRRPSAKDTTIHAYDCFIWDPRLGFHSPPTRFGPYNEGDSFRAEFEHVVRRWRNRITVHEGDLLQESWTGEPIELLLVDAMKSWDLATHIVREFFPALLESSGHLIHQDFSHCFTPWIPLASYRLLDYLEPVKDIPGSESLVFRSVRPLPASEGELTRASFDETEIEQAFDYWLNTTPPEKHSGLRAAKVLLAHCDGDAERASSMRRSLDNRDLLSEFHRTTLKAVMDSGND
jgi:hypothetical protein